MRVLELDASRWETIDDFYDAVLAVVGAPDWHGRVSVALVDTMSTPTSTKLIRRIGSKFETQPISPLR